MTTGHVYLVGMPGSGKSSAGRALAEVLGLPFVDLDQEIERAAGSTIEAQANIGTEVSEKLVRYSDNGSTLSAVNFPEVSLPSHPGKQRLLHIHRNQPGVLSAFNGVFSGRQINIAAEYLNTDVRIGYVVVDIECADAVDELELKRKLEEVPGTIRTRILY